MSGKEDKAFSHYSVMDVKKTVSRVCLLMWFCVCVCVCVCVSERESSSALSEEVLAFPREIMIFIDVQFVMVP